MLELYIKEGCPYCQKQIEQLKQEGLVFKLYNVSSDYSALQTVKEKHAANIVPVLVENGEIKSIGFEGRG